MKKRPCQSHQFIKPSARTEQARRWLLFSPCLILDQQSMMSCKTPEFLQPRTAGDADPDTHGPTAIEHKHLTILPSETAFRQVYRKVVASTRHEERPFGQVGHMVWSSILTAVEYPHTNDSYMPENLQRTHGLGPRICYA